jgi:hypothetical protein
MQAKISLIIHTHWEVKHPMRVDSLFQREQARVVVTVVPFFD